MSTSKAVPSMQQVTLLTLPEAVRRRLNALLEVETPDFRKMALNAGFDPASSFRGKVLCDIDFGPSDLSGIDFTGADLSGCDFSRSRNKETVIPGLQADIQQDVSALIIENSGIQQDRRATKRKSPRSSSALTSKTKELGFNEDIGSIKRRRKLAESISTPPEILARLAEEVEGDMQWRVAGNPSTPSEVLIRLAEKGDGGIKQRIAGNPSTPSQVLYRLARERSERNVRLRVAENRSADPDTLTYLAQDEWYLVRVGVAKNPSTPQDALALLANDRDHEVRWGAVGNPTAAPNVIHRLPKK